MARFFCPDNRPATETRRLEVPPEARDRFLCLPRVVSRAGRRALELSEIATPETTGGTSAGVEGSCDTLGNFLSQRVYIHMHDKTLTGSALSTPGARKYL